MKQARSFSKVAQALEIESARMEGAAARSTVFVIFGSRAWAKWTQARAAQGLPSTPRIWNAAKQRYGWYFPTLFPAAADFAPPKPSAPSPGEGESMARLARLPKPC